MSSVVVGVDDPAAPALLHAAADLAAAFAAPLVVVHVEERNWLVDANVAAGAGAGAGAHALAAAQVADRCHLDCEGTWRDTRLGGRSSCGWAMRRPSWRRRRPTMTLAWSSSAGAAAAATART